MTHARKKLLLREDEAEMIEYALTELLSYYKIIDTERKRNPIFRRTNIVPAESAAAEVERILKLVQDAEATAEIVNALRCTATVQTGDEPCASCLFNRVEALTEEQKAQLHCDEWQSCDVDGVALATADLIEQLEKEKAALIDAANPRKLCEICKNDSYCFDARRDGNRCDDCNQYRECPCADCLSHPKFEWKGLEDT